MRTNKHTLKLLKENEQISESICSFSSFPSIIIFEDMLFRTFNTILICYLKVKEDSYKTHQELRLHIEYSKRQNKYYEPIHLYLAHQQELKKEFVRAESILQKLGNFAALVRQMIVQGLVTTIRQDAKSFLCNVLKVKRASFLCI